MLRAQILLTVSFLVAAGQTSLSNMDVVRMDGIGPIRIGMTLREVNKALRTSYSTPTEPDERSCFYVDVPGHHGLELMILNGRFVRVDVDDKTTKTEVGIHNGDSERSAMSKYGGKLKVEPQFYSPETGHYLTLFSADKKYALRFESDDGKVTRYYAGKSEAVSFVEGCS